jgi:hypothetical protein
LIIDKLLKSLVTTTILKWLSEPSGTLCIGLSLIILRDERFREQERVFVI